MRSEDKKDIVERLPPPFREQYSSLFAGPEPETLHPDLYQRLIDDGTDVIVQQLKGYNLTRKSLVKKAREEIKVGLLKQDERIAKMRVIASDAGNNGVDLRSAFVPLYASAALCAEGWTIIDEPIFRAGQPDLWADEFRCQERESLLTSRIQFEITEEAIEQWDPKAVIVDGSLFLNFWLLPPAVGTTKEYNEDFRLAMIRSIGLLHFCCERDIPIVGFVKRTRINHICKKFGVPKLRDTALMDLILDLGEYTIPTSGPLVGQVVDRYKRESERVGLPKSIIEKITNIHSSYIKTGLTTPFRVEVPEYCVDRLEEMGTVLLTTSEEDGLPFSINEADRLTNVTTSISNIRTLMIYSKALDLVKSGEMDPEDLNLLSLQHGEQWALRDESYLSSISSDQGGR